MWWGARQKLRLEGTLIGVATCMGRIDRSDKSDDSKEDIRGIWVTKKKRVPQASREAWGRRALLGRILWNSCHEVLKIKISGSWDIDRELKGNAKTNVN